MKVIAVIVNYHSDEQVARLLKIIKPAVTEVVVVDNNKINRGFAGGVNLGIKMALRKGAEGILLINPDLKIPPKQIRQLVNTPGDIVGPVLTFQRNGQTIYDFGGKVNWLLSRPTHWENGSGPIEYLSGACLLIKSEVFKKIGFFDEQFFMYFEDVDFCLRAKHVGFSIAVNPDVVVSHQIVEQRATNDQFKINENLKSNWRFILKWQPLIFKPLGFLYLAALFILINFKQPDFYRR